MRIDVLMYLLMYPPIGRHPKRVLHWVKEVKPAVWSEIQKAVNTQLS